MQLPLNAFFEPCVGTQLKSNGDARRPDEAVSGDVSTGSGEQFDEIVAAFFGDIGTMNSDDRGEERISHTALTARTEGLARAVGTRIFGKKPGEKKI